MIIYLASLKSVPDKLYEAASIDGATWWQCTRYVTFPMTRNVIAIVMLFSLIGGFIGFTIVNVLTNGGLLGTTQVLATAAFVVSFAPAISRWVSPSRRAWCRSLRWLRP